MSFVAKDFIFHEPGWEETTPVRVDRNIINWPIVLLWLVLVLTFLYFGHAFLEYNGVLVIR